MNTNIILLLCSPLFTNLSSGEVIRVEINRFLDKNDFPTQLLVSIETSTMSEPNTFNLPFSKFSLPIAIIKESEELNLLRESIGKHCGDSAQNHLKKTMDSYFLGYQLWDNIATAFTKSGFVLNSKIDADESSIKTGGYKKEVMFFSKVLKNEEE